MKSATRKQFIEGDVILGDTFRTLADIEDQHVRAGLEAETTELENEWEGLKRSAHINNF